MLLPQNKRKDVSTIENFNLWLYGQPFSGKTTFADKFDNVLFINTDGNVDFITSPYILVRDEKYKEGRMLKVNFGWDKFREIILELETDDTFETVVIDLVDDIYQMCRDAVCSKHGWSHESDDSFKAWDIVRSEFIETMRRLMTLKKNVILISHEDATKDITKKSGDKITAIKPNIADKVANKLAGMVHLVGRVTKEHELEFYGGEGVFNGGRLTKNIPGKMNLDPKEFTELFK